MKIRKHKITITLDWASINKDVQDKAFRMARLAKLGVENPTAADILESEISLSEEDMSLLRRAMTQGLAEVITMCNQYVWSTSHISDNYIIDDDTLTITLMMPVNFNLAGCESLGQMMHAYVIAKAMTEWFRYTVPARAQEQQVLCDNARAEIQKILNARVRMTPHVRALEIIVGDKKPTVTMLYSLNSSEIFTDIPGQGDFEDYKVRTASQRKVTVPSTIDSEHAKCAAAALPAGYVLYIAGKQAGEQLGKVVYDDKVYVWWTDGVRHKEEFEITY